MLTAKIAHQKWRYESETGQFYWRYSPRYGIFAGDRAGYVFNGEYWALKHGKTNYKASRVAWLMVTGSWPSEQIDHINGNKSDDRFCNLREASNRENCRNRGIKSTNKLGVKGVSLRGKFYHAKICVDGKESFLGAFYSLEEAQEAYQKAAVELHGEFARFT